MTRTTIDVWIVDLTFPGYMDAWYELANRFDERHPELHVEIRAVPFFTGGQEVAAAVRAGEAPAVAEFYYYLNRAARDLRAPGGKRQFTSVERAIGGRSEVLGEPVVLPDIIPPLRDYYTHQGDLAGMPSVGTTPVLYANADILRAAGVGMPRTWQEVEEVCAAVRALPDGPEHGITWANHGMFFQQALASAGGLLADGRNGRDARAGRVDLTSPEMMAFVRRWSDLHRAGHYLYTGSIPDWMGGMEAFAQGRVALRLSSSNDVNFEVRSAAVAGFELEVGTAPYDADLGHTGNVVAGSSLWLSDGLSETVREGALAFLQFAHSPANAAERHKGNSFLPLTTAAHELLAGEGWFSDHPYHRAASDQLRFDPSERAGGGWPESQAVVLGDFARVQDILTRAMHDVLTENADPFERFALAETAAQALLDGYEAEAATAEGPTTPERLLVEFFTDAEAYSGADFDKVPSAG